MMKAINSPRGAKTASVGLKCCAMGRSAERPPSRAKNKACRCLFRSLPAKAVSRRLRPIAQDFSPTIFLASLALLPLSAQAKSPQPAPGVPRVQAQAFQLGYALRAADLSAVAYTQSVQSLKNVTDPKVAGAEVAHFKSEVPALRRSQAASYTLTASLLTQMGAPPSLRAWAAQSAAALNAPLVYLKDARKLAKTEPDTAAVSAELTEIQNIKAAADAQQLPLTLWLNLTGGKAAPWSADVGAYAAALRRASSVSGPTRLSSVTAQALLRHAPPDAPAAARGALAALIPQGGGNLQNLATLAPSNVTAAKITHAAETLLMLYGAAAEAEALDKSAA